LLPHDFSPDRPQRTAEIHADHIQAFETQAYSHDGSRRKQVKPIAKTACEPFANRLKPKEIRRMAQAASGVLTCSDP
jgi:hypothetical protein